MNRLLFLLPAAALAACQSPAPATSERPSETTGNLIIGYDPAVGIDWPLAAPPLLSGKDAAGSLLAQAVLFD